jgi:hypothetical protein
VTLRRRPDKPDGDLAEPAPTWWKRNVRRVALGMDRDPQTPRSPIEADFFTRKVWASLPEERRRHWWEVEP